MNGPPEGLARAVSEIVGEAVPELPVTRLREWLAGRGLGLVPVAEPAAFNWPGRWIALTSTGRAVVMFGVPSGPLHDALADGEAVASALIVAPHDLRLEWRRERGEGTVEAIVVAAGTAGPARRVDIADALDGVGLAGDRYATGGGTFAAPGRTGTQVTLVEVEALEAAGVRDTDARRNIVTRGVDLDGLIGVEFVVGEARFIGCRRAEPCRHLERLTFDGVMRALVHRGGLRADVVAGGRIRVGDRIAPAG